ncbi:GD10658 [Drosophila simulans]|uniref:GD10658 n=1 Tax=Drosophila simulans TaxID=7240 RepID=B4QH97_DROSI|nr:GD10658 [Drosophila simulans]
MHGEPIKLPDNLESLPRADSFPSQRHRWNTNEEIAAILISFDKHGEWQSKEVRTRPKSGSLLLYSRKKVRYRRDGYCWKKRKDGKTTREDHMKLKVQGTECIYGCYVHSAILPTFHRRCYWLLQNPDIVLVHYLNVPYPDDNKMAVIAPSITLWGDKKEWTKEELVSQLKPMLSTINSDDDSDSGNDIEISTAETVESIVCQLMEKQRLSRQAALVKQLDCGCGDGGCVDGKTCTHPVMRRSAAMLKSSVQEKRLGEPFNGNTPNVVEPQVEALSFFNETLDVSHEDIQRTLIANMPYNTTAAGATAPSTTITTGNTKLELSQQEPEKKPEMRTEPATDVEEDETDDVFANLDAFDMLVEFPELDLDDKQALNNTALEQSSFLGESAPSQPRKVHNICDFSPEWSYTEGGVKVLVAGPWTSSNGGAYTVLFDAQPVPTQLVQEGVLRCYCPAHEAGFVTLQVACGGFLVSNSVMFEYKLSLLADAPFDATSSNDCLYKFTLLNRLSTIDEKLQVKTEHELTTDNTALYLEPNFEEKLVAYCHKLIKHAWSMPSTAASWTVGLRGMTLLHLAAALGYAKLVGAMLNWRSENPHIILETELDALSQDVYGFTPLAWACVRGHVECSLLLYKWNHNALKIKTQAQQTPLDLASMRGHKVLLAQMYRLEKERCPEAEEQHQSFSAFDLELQRKHDGVFLRPVAVHSNQSPPNGSSRYSKRSSIDSGINMDIRSKSGKPLARLHSNFESHDSYALGVDSPLDSLTGTNCLLSPLRKMDFALCEVSTGESSPVHDKDCDDNSTSATDVTIGNDLVLPDAVVGDSDAKVLTLAEHIIAAMPERIKNEADEMMVLGSPLTEPLTSESSALTDSFMDPLLDSLPNTHFDSDFSFDFHDHSYRYHDVSTPCSSLSPASSGPLQSPASYSILGTDPSVSSPSPPPSTKQLTEFLHASSISSYPFEADFSKLTLTDTEQRELYEAAKCIQKAYRSYKGRQKLEEQNKERSAATVIQNYYRRYKQYAYYRQMTNAALVIQHGYRSYRRNKRFKKSGLCLSSSSDHGSVSSNSQCLSSFYDHYKQDQQQLHEMGSQPSTPKETSPSGPLKRTYSQSTQNQAARKIQQFMRQSRIKLQKERAEKEKLVHQRRAEYLQNLQFQGQQEMLHFCASSGNTMRATTTIYTKYNPISEGQLSEF